MAGFGEVVERLRRSTVQVRAHRNSNGSGIVWSRDGAIMTNAHVVEGAASQVEVEFWDGRRMAARIATRDRRRDVAALQVDTSGLAAAALGDSTALRVGELVIAVGNPLGFTGAASTGVIYRLNRNSWVVSQLRLAPGNSGGPLANARGEVVGINTMIAGGLAFAIPRESAEEALKGGNKAELGVVVRPVPVNRRFGLMVLEVIPGSPAECASLLQGDILVGMHGKPFSSLQDLESGIRASQGVLELQFRRGASGNLRTVAVRMAQAAARAA